MYSLWITNYTSTTDKQKTAWQHNKILVNLAFYFSFFSHLVSPDGIPKAQNTVGVSYLWLNYCLQILIYTKAFEFHYFWCYSLVWRWEIAVRSEMPTPRGVVKLWSALRAYIDLTCAWKSPWTNHMQPRFPLLADGCGRPQVAFFSSSLDSPFFRLLYFFSYFCMDE